MAKNKEKAGAGRTIVILQLFAFALISSINPMINRLLSKYFSQYFHYNTKNPCGQGFFL